MSQLPLPLRMHGGARHATIDELAVSGARHRSPLSRHWPPAQISFELQRRPAVGAMLIGLIERAFEHVRRDGGITLHQSYVLDDYGDTAQLLAAERLDPEQRWQDISDEKLERFGNGFSFHDLVVFPGGNSSRPRQALSVA